MLFYPKIDCLKIAIVEDHADLRELFVDVLCGIGHEVVGFDCAEDLDEHLADKATNLLILDLNLPGEDGYSIALRLRGAHPGLHILMLTARTSMDDRIRGYLSGADMYLTKPVSPLELGVVVDSIARRVAVAQGRREQITLDTARQQVAGVAGSQTLTPPEVQLLKGLAEAPSLRLDYWRMQELLNLDADEKGKAALEVRISRLKKKLHGVGVAEPAIKSLWKEGYQLCVPVRIVS